MWSFFIIFFLINNIFLLLTCRFTLALLACRFTLALLAFRFTLALLACRFPLALLAFRFPFLLALLLAFLPLILALILAFLPLALILLIYDNNLLLFPCRNQRSYGLLWGTWFIHNVGVIATTSTGAND